MADRFEVVGAAGYYYVVDTKTGTEFFKDQGISKEELQGKATRLSEGYAKIEAGGSDSGTTTSGAPPEKAPDKPETKKPAENKASDDSGQEKETSKEAPKSATGTSAKIDYKAMAKPNPLSKFTSYTYGLSLYMLTAEAFANFVKKGGSLTGIKGKGSGVFVVAQSGGINSDVEDRAITISKTPGDGDGYDYFLEDLDLTLLIPGGSGRASPTTDIKFKIVEAQSFNFLRDLSIASDAVNKMSAFVKDIDPASRPNAISQHFVMGVKFYGYDISGKMVTGDNAEVQGYDNGDKTDQNAVLQRWYPLKITDMKFSLAGNKATTYNITCVPIQEAAAFGELNATIQNGAKIVGRTVGEAISGPNGILTHMNRHSEGQKDVEKIGIPNVLEVEFLDENGKVVKNGEIESAGLVDDVTFSAETAPSSKVTGEATVADSFTAVAIEKGTKSINIAPGTNLMTVLDNLIIKSKYIGDALAATKSPVAGENKIIAKTPTKTLTWFSIVPVVEPIGRDDKTNLWAYKVKYQIRPFKVPYLKTTVGSTVSKYPGPSKYYEYWLTGGNSEVLSYTQEYNSLIYVPQMTSENKDTTSKKIKDGTPVGTRNATTGSSVASDLNRSSEINDNVAAQLYSPADNSTAKLKIIGDPDYLMSGVTNPNIESNLVYSKDGSIDGRSSQVFIQVTFNTGADYGPNGLFNVDDRIQFYKTDKVKKMGIDGIVFKVNQVHSTFSKGKFEQELELMIVSESMLISDETQPEGGERAESSDSGDNAAKDKNKTTTTKAQQVQSQSHTSKSANSPTGKPQKSNVDVRKAQGSGEDIEYVPPGDSDAVIAESMRTPNYEKITDSNTGGGSEPEPEHEA